MNYIKTPRSSMPESLRFDIPRQNQGQIVEVAYADERPCAGEAGRGSKYMRVYDRSDGSLTYYELEDPELAQLREKRSALMSNLDAAADRGAVLDAIHRLENKIHQRLQRI